MKLISNEQYGVGVAIEGFDFKQAANVADVKKLLYTNKMVILRSQSFDEQGFCDLSYS